MGSRKESVYDKMKHIGACVGRGIRSFTVPDKRLYDPVHYTDHEEKLEVGMMVMCKQEIQNSAIPVILPQL